jgi:hypothetical protein
MKIQIFPKLLLRRRKKEQRSPRPHRDVPLELSCLLNPSGIPVLSLKNSMLQDKHFLQVLTPPLRVRLNTILLLKFQQIEHRIDFHSKCNG